MIIPVFRYEPKRAGSGKEGYAAASQNMIIFGKVTLARRPHSISKLSRPKRRATYRNTVQPILDRELEFFEPLNLGKVGPAPRQLRADFIIKPTVNGEKTVRNNRHNATPCFSVAGSERVWCG
jgi:hypothetical protein